MRRQRSRPGMTLIEVALATVIITVGTLATGLFFRNIYGQLTPRGEWGGLRRYVMAEEMAKAQAEGLRVLRTIPLKTEDCKLITEPTGLNYQLDVTRSSGPPATNEQLYYYDIQVTHQGRLVTTLSLSTLRSTDTKEGQDEKIGL